MAVNQTLPKVAQDPMSLVIEQAEKDQNWDNLTALSQAVAEGIVVMGDSIQESMNIVSQGGCNNINEYNILVNKTNQDIVKFHSEYEKIAQRHTGRTGQCTGPSDRALLLSIYEDYVAFSTYFNGALHNTMIAFTEFAIEARDRLYKKAKENGELDESDTKDAK